MNLLVYIKKHECAPVSWNVFGKEATYEGVVDE